MQKKHRVSKYRHARHSESYHHWSKLLWLPCTDQVNDPDTHLCFFFLLSHYCALKKSFDWFQKDAVAISHVVYKNIKGTRVTDLSMKFDCSGRVPCRGIVLQDINLVGENGNSTKSSCNHVNLIGSGVVPPPCEKNIWKIISKKLLCLYTHGKHLVGSLSLFDQIFIYDYLCKQKIWLIFVKGD